MKAHYDIAFIVEPFDVAAEAAMLEDNLHVTMARLDGLTIVAATVLVDGDLIEDLLTFAIRLSQYGITVIRLDLDLVNQSSIAARCEVSRAAVSQWVSDARLHNPFPKPHTVVNGPIWAWSDINEWLRRTGKQCFDDSCSPNPVQVEQFNARWRQQRRPDLIIKPRTDWQSVTAAVGSNLGGWVASARKVQVPV
ncbi:MAG: hypothetical protein FWG16_07970 [Micrococcales bacterium]|nr:hypothetical protein [Micrococcales bacterium]